MSPTQWRLFNGVALAVVADLAGCITDITPSSEKPIEYTLRNTLRVADFDGSLNGQLLCYDESLSCDGISIDH